MVQAVLTELGSELAPCNTPGAAGGPKDHTHNFNLRTDAPYSKSWLTLASFMQFKPHQQQHKGTGGLSFTHRSLPHTAAHLSMPGTVS